MNTNFLAMIGNFKNIHIGKLIAQRMKECEIETERAAKFLDVSEEEIEQTYLRKSIDSYALLRWSKLLKYDFFRIYSQHLILYAPEYRKKEKKAKKEVKSVLPTLKKNLYTQEMILYLMELVESGKKTGQQIQKEYNIPATTILRWINKYKKRPIMNIDSKRPFYKKLYADMIRDKYPEKASRCARF